MSDPHPAADMGAIARRANVFHRTLALELPEGENGVLCTVAAMRAVIDHAATRYPCRAWAAERIVGCNATDAARHVYHWVRRHIRFRRDAEGVEHLRHPDLILAAVSAHGGADCDCDDATMLAAALLQAAGIRASLIVVSPAWTGPWVHILWGIRAAPGAALIPFDPQEAVGPGEFPPGVARMLEFP